jgi:hypothetical protein
MDFPKSVPGVGLVNNEFVDEDEVSGAPGSLIPAKWGNDVTKEILGVLAEAGIEPDEDNPEQLREAVKVIVDKVAPVASEQDEQEGTDNIKRMTPLRVAEAIARRIPADTTIYQFGHIGGHTLANNAATPSSDIDISAGSARAASNNASLLLAATLTKRLQSAGAWAAGPGGNGLFAGLRSPNTWYHVFLIRRDSDGLVDAGFDTAANAANRPEGWSSYRRIGSIKTDASGAIIRFKQFENRFYWHVPMEDVSASLAASGSATYVVTAPPLEHVISMVQYYVSGPNAMVYFGCPDLGAVVSNATNYFAYGANSNANPDGSLGYLEVPLSAQSQLVATANAYNSGAATIKINCLGWIDPRGAL